MGKRRGGAGTGTRKWALYEVVRAVLRVIGTVAVIIMLAALHVCDDVFTSTLLFVADNAESDVRFRGRVHEETWVGWAWVLLLFGITMLSCWFLTPTYVNTVR